MPIQFLNRVRGGGSRAFDSDVLSWRDAVASNGGSVSLARLIVVDQFVFSEKASGAWALTDDYWGFWAENAIQALTSLKQRRLASAVNSPVFTADRDYTFDAVSNYINTSFIPTTHGINYTGANQRIAVYERTNISGTSAVSAGASVATTNRISIIPRSSGSNMSGNVNTNSTTPTFTLPAADSRGYSVLSRANSLTTLAGYKNGGRLTDFVGTASTNGQNIAVYIGANDNLGTPNLFRGASVGLLAMGAPLSDAQEAAQYAAVQAWATSVGASV